MDTKELVTHSRARFDHHQARQVLRDKYQAKLHFAHAGGMWCAGPELQATLLTCPDIEAVLIDLYETPVRVDVKELMTLSQQRWQEQMTAWLTEYEQISKNR
jgi:hypothetical protein